MFCTKCGARLHTEDDRFCSQCGTRTAVAGRVESPARALLLDKRNKKIAGVCAGFARYIEEDVTLIRVLWLGLAVATGVGFLAYIAAWLIMPSDQSDEVRVPAARAPQTV
jgi:phage shock protein C